MTVSQTGRSHLLVLVTKMSRSGSGTAGPGLRRVTRAWLVSVHPWPPFPLWGGGIQAQAGSPLGRQDGHQQLLDQMTNFLSHHATNTLRVSPIGSDWVTCLALNPSL